MLIRRFGATHCAMSMSNRALGVDLRARRLCATTGDPFGMFGNLIEPAQRVGVAKHLCRAHHPSMFTEKRPAPVPQRKATDVGKQPSGLIRLARTGKGCGNGPCRSGQSRIIGQMCYTGMFLTSQGQPGIWSVRCISVANHFIP